MLLANRFLNLLRQYVDDGSRHEVRFPEFLTGDSLPFLTPSP
jgi:hypothetical protein